MILDPINQTYEHNVDNKYTTKHIVCERVYSDGDMNTEINKMIQCRWNNWRKISGVPGDKGVPPHVRGKMHKMIVQSAMRCGTDRIPMTSCHVKKLEVTDMTMCRWACGHTLRDHVRNDDTRERLKVENTTVRCRKARIRLKKDS